MTLSSAPALTSSLVALPAHGDSRHTSPDDQGPSKKQRRDTRNLKDNLQDLADRKCDGKEAEIALVLQYDDFSLRLHQYVVLLNIEATMDDHHANKLHAKSAFYTNERQPWNVDRIDGEEQISIEHQMHHEPCLQVLLDKNAYTFPLRRVKLICVGPVFNFRHRIYSCLLYTSDAADE